MIRTVRMKNNTHDCVLYILCLFLFFRFWSHTTNSTVPVTTATPTPPPTAPPIIAAVLSLSINWINNNNNIQLHLYLHMTKEHYVVCIYQCIEI